MSIRSLLEINHDFPPARVGLEWLAAMNQFYWSGDPKALPQGVTFLQTRHHSDPAPKGWVPPQDRGHGHRCLGFFGARTTEPTTTGAGWKTASWDASRALWLADGMSIMWCRNNQPTVFQPMPATPGNPRPPPAQTGCRCTIVADCRFHTTVQPRDVKGRST